MARKRVFHGLSVSPGVAIGKVQKIDLSVENYPKYWITEKEINAESRRFRKAIQQCQQYLLKLQQDLCKFQVGEKAQILDSYQLIAKDQSLREATLKYLNNELVNVEWAFMKAVDTMNASMGETNSDLCHVAHQILKHLAGQEHSSLPQFKKGAVVVAPDLSPADMAHMSRSTVSGFATVAGGTTSHTAIMARALEIPAVAGIEDIDKAVEEEAPIIIDGSKGIVILHPRAADLKKYRTLKKKHEQTDRLLLKEAQLPAITLDGFEIRLSANIELIEEIPIVKSHGAHAIGLYRTEAFFLRRQMSPSEDDQYEHYRRILGRMKPRRVTIRTLDIGGEKVLPDSLPGESLNPALGLRSIRYCLHDKALFTTQLRALLRASRFGKLRILLPMISSLDEIRAVTKLIDNIRQELREAKIRVSRQIEVGAMIETPAAAVMADAIAAEVDFLSIGTNDLTQYCLAVDRTNEQVSPLYDPYHPAIIRLLKQIVDAGRSRNIEVCICGEIAGDPEYFPILLGLGVTELSMNPHSIPLVNRRLRQSRFKDSNQALEECLHAKTADEVRQAIKKIH